MNLTSPPALLKMTFHLGIRFFSFCGGGFFSHLDMGSIEDFLYYYTKVKIRKNYIVGHIFDIPSLKEKTPFLVRGSILRGLIPIVEWMSGATLFFKVLFR
jgi:hypothetical protein